MAKGIIVNDGDDVEVFDINEGVEIPPLNIVFIQDRGELQVVFMNIHNRAEARREMSRENMAGYPILVARLKSHDISDLLRARLMTDPDVSSGFAARLNEVFSAAYHNRAEVDFPNPCDEVLKTLCLNKWFRTAFEYLLAEIRKQAKSMVKHRSF